MEQKKVLQNILVTGGSGFIGSNFIRHIHTTYPNYRVINLDFLTYAGNPDNLKDIEEQEKKLPADAKRYIFVRGDICDEKLVSKIFDEQKPEIVVNFAAESHVDRSLVDMSDFIRTNIGGVRVLVEAVRNHKTPRFVHISTDEVYGSIQQGVSTEESLLRPSSPYSSSKASADLIAQAFIHTHKAPIVIVRGSNNYGPFQYPEKLIPLAISNMIEGKTIPIHGDGSHARSWLHVNDFCRAIDLAMHKAPTGHIYNVSGEERTNLEILSMLADNLKVDIAKHRVHINDRPGADLRYAPDSTKIARDLGWKRAHSLADDMPRTVSWYLDNRAWWEKIKQKREFLDHYEKQSTGKWF